MATSTLLAIALRGSLLIGLGIAIALLLRRSSASTRRWVVLLTLIAAAVLPAIAVVPSRPVARVVPAPEAARIVAETLSFDAPREGLATRDASPEVSATPDAPLPWGSVLFGIWLLGAVAVLGRLAVGLVLARRLARRAEGDGLVRTSREVDVPMAVGVIAPVVLLPPDAGSWSEDRRRAVLLHEGAHVRRRDGLALVVGQIACAVYWFQPLAWWALRRLRRECELAADEAVIGTGLRPSAYAEHLIAIARSVHVPAGAIASASRPSELADRIGVLVGRRRLPAPMSTLGASLLALGACAALILAACADATPPAPATADEPAAVAEGSTLQSIVDDEAQRIRAAWSPGRVVIVVLDPATGAVLGATDDGGGAPYLPGSTWKPLTVAVALDAGVLTPEQTFDCGNGERSYGALVLRDAGNNGTLSVSEILAVSSNVGMSHVFDVLGAQRLVDGFARLHMPIATPVEDGTFQGAVTAIGQRETTTPLALARAYAAIANDGLYVAPGSGSPADRSERWLKESTARQVRSMLEGAVHGDRATGRAAALADVKVAGKTGTSDGAEVFASFVGMVPADRPRFVVLVGVGAPAKEGTGGTIAAPAFARIAERILSAPRDGG